VKICWQLFYPFGFFIENVVMVEVTCWMVLEMSTKASSVGIFVVVEALIPLLVTCMVIE